MSADLITSYVIDDANVSWERLAGEVIAIQLATGHYYSMGGVAADIWSLLTEESDVEAISQVLANHYQLPENSKTEIEHFLINARSVKLVKIAQQVSETPRLLPDDFTRASWVTPILQEYTDLQDLILVDPVHDTKATGWPELKEE